MADTNLVQLIKRIALDAFNASKPCTTIIGKVKSVSPIKIKCGDKILLDKDFLDITTTASERLTKGAKVVMIRQAGGQKYTVIDTLKN